MTQDGELKNTKKHIEALTDPYSDVRKHAAKALGNSKDRQAVLPLIKALKDRNPGVRKVAASSLGEIKDRRAVEPLTKALRDDVDDVREEAAKALRSIMGGVPQTKRETRV